jgi:ATP-dependent exoDNAse (exonuclease V) alpha subunit
VVLIDDQSYCWTKSALFTAISRAKSKCIIIGKPVDFVSIQTKSVCDKQSLFLCNETVDRYLSVEYE